MAEEKGSKDRWGEKREEETYGTQYLMAASERRHRRRRRGRGIDEAQTNNQGPAKRARSYPRGERQGVS